MPRARIALMSISASSRINGTKRSETLNISASPRTGTLNFARGQQEPFEAVGQLQR
jgi:hypothetical protein